MVKNSSKKHAWTCAICGHIYGMETCHVCGMDLIIHGQTCVAGASLHQDQATGEKLLIP